MGLFRGTADALRYPAPRLGYMEVARVARSRSPAFAEGDLVAAAYGHATAHVADPVHEHVVPLPADLDPVLGVYVAHMGPICANGLLHAAADAIGGPVRSLADGVAGRRGLGTRAGGVGPLPRPPAVAARSRRPRRGRGVPVPGAGGRARHRAGGGPPAGDRRRSGLLPGRDGRGA